ncbi:TIGR03943 family protein [Microbacterium sp. MEC084]|uniref:TIGR03943 family putative permease subunit n=1 Tax=Microbacterium sp. MEC084 TaxID=1963027 RepID=UPI001070240E|nr:TIGR03943 family protein [Microbacterium sp. MEC084]MCD1267957.1 TIGR03943 family protein [Microbacterium sp. MEC084]
MTDRWGSVGTRWLGVGLAAVLAVVTLGLAVTDRLALYINPDQTWFAVGMAVLALIGAVASFVLPLGAEGDHGHDHGHAADHAHGARAEEESAAPGRSAPHSPRPAAFSLSRAATATGGVLASAVAVAALVLPPASLSVDLAMARDTGTAPLFAGADQVLLAAADTSEFGVGDWASVFSSATSPDAYEGTHVTLTGFVTPDEGNAEALRLGRLVITHCVIDAQPASVPVVSPDWRDAVEVGGWIQVDGIVTTDASGALLIEPREISSIPEPSDPYEY